ncbi:YcxB-like protein [Sediminihabitans luteus]|uniref:YcxB-like protein n=1 Tax=Sediminihabitans luteus TaxID=1138585 RepID=A0A2M9CEI7_9CELL|nr:YcxB family protein [Sediminihabitans luteus]PJJ70299.1 YcxB-like protein [Sediminihabitans luteus]GII97770.1 hypothetical protein Slu03_01480 [Sediminihabitans luteus]
MQIDYVATTDDQVAYAQHLARTSPVLVARARNQRLAVTAAVLVIPVLLIGLVVGDWLGGLVVAAIGAAVMWFVFPAVGRKELARNIDRLAAVDGLGATGAANLRTDDEGLHEDVAGLRTSVAWSGVSHVEETDSHGFVRVGASEAFIVPKRAAGAAELLAEVRRRAEGERAG